MSALENKMKEKELKREYIQKLFIFIDHILQLPRRAEDKWYHELKPLVEKNTSSGGYRMIR